MRKILVALLLSLGVATPTLAADVHVSIGINVPAYPTLVRVPSYPVYYAPSLRANYFFYDGLYWVYRGDVWYSSHWYNGPWYVVDPYDVPLYVLRVPVRYYRVAPASFHVWAYDAPPHWGEVWGSSWATRRAGWDTWSRASAPAPAPLPVYQRSYSGTRYPATVAQQATIQARSYSYQPREVVARQQFQERRSLARMAPPQQARAQEQRQERAQQARAQPQRQERVQQAQQPRPESAQPRPERVQQAQRREQQAERREQQAERREQHAQRQQANEPRGREKAKGKDQDRDEKG